MPQLRRFAAFVLPLLLLPAAGCDDGRRVSSGDGGPGVDGGPPPPPSGRVGLDIEGAAWSLEGAPGRDTLYVQVRLGNGTATNAELGPSLFSLSTTGGADVLGGTASFGPGTPCAADLSVSPGASLACVVAFGVPTGDSPRRVDYRTPDGREASADIAACDPGSSAGLCPAGLVCTSSGCAASCSAGAPTGFCSDPGERCVSGTCVGPCGFDRPAGYCDEGRCVDGACVTGCRRVLLDGDCLSCVLDAYETCPAASCMNAESCTNCVISEDTCACASECAGCESEIDSILNCAESQCPGCVE